MFTTGRRGPQLPVLGQERPNLGRAGIPWVAEQELRWFVTVVIGDGTRPRRYALGPLGSWSRARTIARQWESEHGAGTAAVTERRPAYSQPQSVLRVGDGANLA